MGIVTLVSGGLDSTIMSLMAHDEGITLYPLFFDYGQLGAAKEWTACQLLHEKYGLPKVMRMDISGYGRTIPSGITNPAMRVNEDAFLPGRNLLFILCGAAYAYRVQADCVAIGLLNPENRLFPDQTHRFLNQCETMIEIAMDRRISVIAPLIEFNKAEVIEMARARGVENTYSCHSGTDIPCGKCVSCIEIKNAKERR
jgi:7-cyano-7-deazaguanine synthase